MVIYGEFSSFRHSVVLLTISWSTLWLLKHVKKDKTSYCLVHFQVYFFNHDVFPPSSGVGLSVPKSKADLLYVRKS